LQIRGKIRREEKKKERTTPFRVPIQLVEIGKDVDGFNYGISDDAEV